MKKINTKRLFALMLAGVLSTSLVGCGGDGGEAGQQTAEEQAAQQVAMRELSQSDYRGGVMRTLSLQENIISVLEAMKSNNITIRQTSPNSFWTTEGYQDFVSTFLTSKIITDTQWFNEEQASWEETVAQISSTASSFTALNGEAYVLAEGVKLSRNEKDDYMVTNVPTSLFMEGEYIDDEGEKQSFSQTVTGTANYRILYDCDKDWCKAYTSMVVNGSNLPAITTELFEYQRIDDNTFAIQTNTERLLVVLQPSEADVSISEREVKEFYYSRLVTGSMRTTYEPYVYLPEEDLLTGELIEENVAENEKMMTFPYMNKEGELAFRYGESDSMFFNEPKDVNISWVFEDKSLQQAICYKDGALVVTTFNKLSTNYERFVYAKTDVKDSLVKELEGLVEISNLVGSVDIKSESTEAPDEPVVNENAAEPTTEGTSEENTTESSEDSTVAENEEATGDNAVSENTTEAEDAEANNQVVAQASPAE